MSSNQEVKEFFEHYRSKKLKRKRIFYYSFLSFTILLNVFAFTGLDRFANWVYNIETPDNLGFGGQYTQDELSKYYSNFYITIGLKRTFAFICLSTIILLIGTSIYFLFQKEMPINKIILATIVITGIIFLLFVAIGIFMAFASRGLIL